MNNHLMRLFFKLNIYEKISIPDYFYFVCKSYLC